MCGTPLIRDNIKENLILHYSDKRNKTSLERDLHNLKQRNNTLEKFYSEVIEIFASITNHVQIHDKDTCVVNAKKYLYSEMCLNTFLSGLKDPLDSTVKAMQPNSFSETFSHCVMEQNINYKI